MNQTAELAPRCDAGFFRVLFRTRLFDADVLKQRNVYKVQDVVPGGLEFGICVLCEKRIRINL